VSLSGTQLEELLDIARRAAGQAADKLASAQATAVEFKTADSRDVKLSADRESEKFLKTLFAEETEYPVLGEEYGMDGSERKDGIRWIIDPLDGTANYQRDLPIYGVSIGLWQNETPLLGVIRDIPRKETFSAISTGPKKGAWIDESGPIRVGGITEKKQAFIATGFPIYSDFSPKAIARFAEEISQYKKVRLLGSAAIMLAYVACGRVDVYRERDIAVWDIAAGLAIVVGAGGEIELKPSEKVNCYSVFASNGKLTPDQI